MSTPEKPLVVYAVVRGCRNPREVHSLFISKRAAQARKSELRRSDPPSDPPWEVREMLVCDWPGPGEGA
jgi:hypothetical protein